MARGQHHHPHYLLQEPQTGLYLSGEQPLFMVGGARLSRRADAARFPTHADAVLAAQDLPAASQPLEIVRADA